MKRIVLDTDFILEALKNRIDVKVELARIMDYNYEICVLDRTLDELKGKKGEKLARTFIESLKIIETSRDKSVDELLFGLNDIIVATQDRELKEKLKNRDIAIITIRQKKFLRFVWNVLRDRSSRPHQSPTFSI